MPFAATWMDLESIILSEVSQRRRNIVWLPSYVESKKMIQTNLLIEQKQTHVLENELMGAGAEAKDGEKG